MQIYDQDARPLHDLIRGASSEHGATLLVPDLQRPYVWSPNQVTLLVDSLLRGWPFGTLLLWDVKKEDLGRIPSRPFWRVVDRTGDGFDDDQVSRSNPPAEFRMVLDGQQRLQSLLLAFGGDSWGFRLLDQEWSAALEVERPRGRYARKHWSLAQLCLDTWRFRELWTQAGELNRIEFRDALTWAVLSPSGGRSTYLKPPNYKFAIPSALDPENKGRFVRLSRLWNVALGKAGTVPRHYYDPLNALLAEHDVPEQIRTEVLDPLAELCLALANVQQAKVSFLLLKPFNDRDFTQDVYNDAIVNIFTRLNTAGRALTRQEITFAWIKTGWDASKTGNRTAGACFEELREALAQEDVVIDIDALVGMVSAMWSVLARDGQLLTANDLLRGEKVRPMAQDLVSRWETICANATDGADVVDGRGLRFGQQYRSLNVLTLLLTWRLLGRQWLAEHPLAVTVRDGFEKRLNALFAKHCDRWIILSQWSGRWGTGTDKAFAEYVANLAADWRQIAAATDPDAVLGVLEARMIGWTQALQSEAGKYIEDLAVLSRDAVHQYALPLWVWHRLDAERWKASAVPLRETKRGRLLLEVDHLVAVKLWERLFGTPAADGNPTGSTAEADDSITVMNSLGNCSLLEKSFNVAKGAEPLRAFLERVHEFKSQQLQVADWSSALDIGASLLDPTAQPPVSIADLRAAITERTTRMKNDIKAFIQGTRDRADI